MKRVLFLTIAILAVCNLAFADFSVDMEWGAERPLEPCQATRM